MKKFMLLALALLGACTAAVADEPADTWKYVDAQDLRVINKGWDNTLRHYTRIPANLKDSVRPDLWERAQCSTGIGVRFATDSKRIGVKYKLLWDTHMIHMAACQHQPSIREEGRRRQQDQRRGIDIR